MVAGIIILYNYPSSFPYSSTQNPLDGSRLIQAEPDALHGKRQEAFYASKFSFRFLPARGRQHTGPVLRPVRCACASSAASALPPPDTPGRRHGPLRRQHSARRGRSGQGHAGQGCPVLPDRRRRRPHHPGPAGKNAGPFPGFGDFLHAGGPPIRCVPPPQIRLLCRLSGNAVHQLRQQHHQHAFPAPPGTDPLPLHHPYPGRHHAAAHGCRPAQMGSGADCQFSRLSGGRFGIRRRPGLFQGDPGHVVHGAVYPAADGRNSPAAG